MKRVVAVGLLLLALGAFAKPSVPASAPHPAASAPWNESQLVEHRSYVNSSGQVVHSPAHTVSGKAPQGATAQCGDGSYSFSQHRRGTCSHHGGVAAWL